MSTLSEELRREVEAVASALGVHPSTVGKRAGQGGHFYRRLCAGKRIWPETAEKVRALLIEMRANNIAHDAKDGERNSAAQPQKVVSTQGGTGAPSPAAPSITEPRDV
ncbi:hypothetical protein [Palleronia aestuarii]|uniref:hypothetical protein n=1 Tax=Palleronia aestuarii TaxID=568105 RepID=UPI0011B65B59|nr:hypothetical protein [Palleronia aestuarii]